jgi:hypothetical protein
MFLRAMGSIGTGAAAETLHNIVQGFGDSNRASIPMPHSIREFDHMHWGVEMARKGRVSPDRVINAMPLAKHLRHLHNRRQTAARAA